MANVTGATKSLQLRYRYSHAAEKVFDAWVDAEGMRRWMRPGPTTDVRSNLDVRVGGKYSIEMIFDQGSVKHWGEYTVVDRPNKLEFTWDADHFREPTTVALVITPTDTGCELVLTHTGLPDEQSAQKHRGGWGTILDLLSRSID